MTSSTLKLRGLSEHETHRVSRERHSSVDTHDPRCDGRQDLRDVQRGCTIADKSIDVTGVEAHSRRMWIAKTSCTPADPSLARRQTCVRRSVLPAAIPESVQRVVRGTTV